MSHCQCCYEPQKRRRFRPFALVFNLLLGYLLLVVGGGTLIKTGHPVAVETGRILHTVTCVEPAIYWADSHGIDPLAGGLKLAANGLPIEKILHHGPGA